MKSAILSLLILSGTVLQAQKFSPTPNDVRLSIAKSITDLHVFPERVAAVTNDFVLRGKDSIAIRIYQPAATGKFPVIYLVHGAAWIAGDLNTHDNICRYLTNAVQAVVVAVDYRRAPEHKFPAAFDDTYAVLKWISTHLSSLNGNGKLVLIGDSAGGQLVASVCLLNSSEKTPLPIIAQVLVNPSLNLSKGSVSYRTYPLFIDWYLNSSDPTDDFRISPLLAKDISKVPPAIIVVGEIDQIRDDGENYNKRLVEAGIVSHLFIQPKMGHLAGRWCAAYETAQPAMNFVVEQLKALLLK